MGSVPVGGRPSRLLVAVPGGFGARSALRRTALSPSLHVSSWSIAMACSRCSGTPSSLPRARVVRVAVATGRPPALWDRMASVEWGKRSHLTLPRQAWTPNLEPTGVGWAGNGWGSRQRERITFKWPWKKRQVEEQDQAGGQPEGEGEANIDQEKSVAESETETDQAQAETDPEAKPSASPELKHVGSLAPANACYIRRSLKKGERVTHPGTVVVFGDVPEGALVQAGADIIVWGRLYGEARAGNISASGENVDTKAVICCLEARPTTLSIGDVYKLDVHRTIDPGVPEQNGPILVTCSSDNDINMVMAGDRTTKMPLKRHSLLRSPPLLTATITGAYISLVGLALMVAPVSVFGLLFDASKIATGWIRVFGVVCVTFGSYYIGSAVGDIRGRHNSFYISTVAGRLFLVVSLCIIVARQELQPSVLILALVNLLGAITMWRALWKNRKQ